MAHRAAECSDHSLKGPRRFVTALSLMLGLAAPITTVQAQTLVLSRVDLVAGGPLIGIAENLRSEISRRTGLTLVVEALPALRAAYMANSGELDGALGRVIEVAQTYPNLLVVPTPVAKTPLAMYVSRPELMTETRDRLGKGRVAMMRGILATAKHGAGMAVTESSSFETSFEMLQAGRVDAALLMYADAATYLGSHAMTGIFLWHWAWAEEPLYLLLNKKHQALVPKIDAALVRMKREGVIDRIYNDEMLKFHVAPLPIEPPLPR
jgi:polar amino acid transport system substrate-binding protein